MDYKNMSADEVLRLAVASTDLERRLLELLDDSQDEDWAREAAELEIEELENGIAFRDQQIEKMAREHGEQTAAIGKLRHSLRQLLSSILNPPPKHGARADAIALASQTLADTK